MDDIISSEFEKRVDKFKKITFEEALRMLQKDPLKEKIKISDEEYAIEYLVLRDRKLENSLQILVELKNQKGKTLDFRNLAIYEDNRVVDFWE